MALLSDARIYRVRPPGFDENGDPVEGDPVRTELTGCTIAPTTSSDINDRGRFGVVTGLSLLGPYGTDIGHLDRIDVVGGPHEGLYEADGEPAHFKHALTGWDAGFTLALRRAAG